MASILIVEDELDTADLWSMWFDQEGDRVVVAPTAEEGLSFLQREPFDVVLMDLSLPGALTGLDATRYIRATPALASLPVLLVTAYPLGEVREAARLAGVDGVVTKPVVDLVAFAGLVHHLIREGRAAAHPLLSLSRFPQKG